jgi:transcriptional regulator with XRE-family HTH domain
MFLGGWTVHADRPTLRPARAPANLNEQGGPTVLRIVLGSQLRRWREAAGVTREAAGDAIRGSHAKISRLELGRVGFKERDLVDLLALYGVTDERERAEFLDLARRANERGWWHQHGHVLPSWFQMYLGLEQAATVIRTYQVQFVPGLLQCADYARNVIIVGHQADGADEIDRRVELRMARKKMLTEPGGPQLWAVIDEAALSRPFGPPHVMRAQLDHVLEMTALPNVTVQVMPFRRGGHAAAGGAFSILRFGEPDLPDVVYLEHLNHASYLDKRSDVEDYLAVMELVSVQAEAPTRSKDTLRRIRSEF